jgi:hypothetical protein
VAERNGKHPPAPTAGEVIALFNLKQQDGQEARLRQLAQTFRTLTRMEHEVNIPDTYKAITRQVRTPYVRDAWLRTTAALTQNPWLPHFDPKSEADKSKRAAGVAERWVVAGTEAMDRDVGIDVPYEACAAMVRDCESVLKVVHRPDAWATFPVREAGEDPTAYVKKAETYKKGSPFPYAWRCLDRLSYLPGDGEFGDEWCIEYGEYPKPYLASRYRMREDPKTSRLVGEGYEEPGRTATPEEDLGGKPVPQGYYAGTTGMSVKVEYFDCYWWCVVVDGSMAPGFPKENPYSPRLPYFRAKPSDEPEAVLYSLLFLVPRLDELLTMWLNWAYLGAYPNPLLQDLPNSNALPPGMLPPIGQDTTPSTFTWRPGKLLEVPRGKAFLFQQPPPIGQDIKELAQVFRALIDIAGIPSILRGANLSGDSGYLANQMISAAAMLYKRLQKARERQLEQAVDFMLYLIPHRIKQTVYVLGQGDEGRSWLGLREKGETTEHLAAIEQLGPITVSAPPDMSVMRQAMAMIAKQLTEGPAEGRLVSRRKAMEDLLGYEDPDTIIDEIWVEDQMANNPEVNALVVQNAMRLSGLATPPKQNPLEGLVAPDGVTPLVPGGLPGQVSGGLPVMPGMGMPMQPPAPGGGMLPGGRPGGAYPGQPPNPPQAPL